VIAIIHGLSNKSIIKKVYELSIEKRGIIMVAGDPFVWLQTVGIAAGIGGGISAFVNYILNIWKAKKDREAIVIQDKLNIYSSFIYYLDELLRIEKINKRSKRDQIKKTLEGLDSTINTKYYMLNYLQLSQFNLIKNMLMLPNYDEARVQIKTLRESLRKDYNNKIIKNYEAIVTKGEVDDIPKIYECDTCIDTFLSGVELDDHKQTMHSSKENRSERSGSAFP
jgi:hypothetical protein